MFSLLMLNFKKDSPSKKVQKTLMINFSEKLPSSLKDNIDS